MNPLNTASVRQHRLRPIHLILLALLLVLTGCSNKKDTSGQNGAGSEVSSPLTGGEAIAASGDVLPDKGSTSDVATTTEPPLPTEPPHTILVPEGNTLENRFNAPAGYLRITSQPGELTDFLRHMEMKEDGSPVLLYDGAPKSNQADHAAVFDMEIGDQDLQQCADSIIRVYAEYYWSLGEYDKIAFHLTNGFFMEYTKWRDGNRLAVKGNEVSWNKSAEYDNSYQAFRKYLNMVFAYAGTLSLSEECNPVIYS